VANDVHSILVIKPSALGEVVLSLPALASLRASFPAARISWLVRPEFAPILEHTDNLDEIIRFDRKAMGRWWYHPGAAAILRDFVRQLRSRHFDLVIDLQGLLRTALFGWMTGSSRRYGLSIAREGARWFYTDRISPRPESCHVIDQYWDVIHATGATIRRTDYGIRIDRTRYDNLDALLDGYGVSSESYAVLVTGSAHPWKCWPVESFAKISEKLAIEYGLGIVAIGTESERGAIDRLTSLSRTPIVNLIGKTDLHGLIALMASARVVISNDTGPGHIAVAMGTPTTMIFGPTNPARVGPYGRTEWVAAVDPMGRGNNINNFDPRYRIENVSIDQVYTIVNGQIAESNR
jgi:lipopolysaccharide heptosyltransferase I